MFSNFTLVEARSLHECKIQCPSALPGTVGFRVTTAAEPKAPNLNTISLIPFNAQTHDNYHSISPEL